MHAPGTVTMDTHNAWSYKCMQVYERTDSSVLDKRYYAKGKKLPFGVDPGKLPEDMTF
jgi:hypothetical protein